MGWAGPGCGDTAASTGRPRGRRAVNQLEAFIHHVEALRGKEIPAEAADELIDIEPP